MSCIECVKKADDSLLSLDPLSLDQTSSSIPKSVLFEFISDVDEQGNTVLHRAAAEGEPLAVQEYLENLQEEEQALILKMQNNLGLTVLDYAVRFPRAEMIGRIVRTIHPNIKEDVTATIAKLMRERELDSVCVVNIFARVLSVDASLIVPDVYVKQVEKKELERLYVYGKTASLLNEMVGVIRAYSEKVHDMVPLKTPNIKIIPDSIVEKAFGYSHYISIHSQLPEHISRSYGNKPQYWIDGVSNCHGTALMVSGMTTRISRSDINQNLTIFASKAVRVAHKDLSVGDIVYLRQKAFGETEALPWLDSHSFVFLNHDHCLSMNGQNRSFGFFPTRIVLSEYGYPKNALEIAQKGEKSPVWLQYIEIYRKKPPAVESSSESLGLATPSSMLESEPA